MQIDFVVEHEGDQLLGAFDVLGFITAGVQSAIIKDGPEVMTVEPGAYLTLSIAKGKTK